MLKEKRWLPGLFDLASYCYLAYNKMCNDKMKKLLSLGFYVNHPLPITREGITSVLRTCSFLDLEHIEGIDLNFDTNLIVSARGEFSLSQD